MHPSLTADLALVVATAGVLLIFFELNRPGSILPGALGLLLVLFGIASLAKYSVRPWAVALLVASALTLASNLYRALPYLALLAAMLSLVAALRFLLAPAAVQPPVHLATAIVCGGLLGSSAAFLSRVAFSARRLKAIH